MTVASLRHHHFPDDDESGIASSLMATAVCLSLSVALLAHRFLTLLLCFVYTTQEKLSAIAEVMRASVTPKSAGSEPKPPLTP